MRAQRRLKKGCIYNMKKLTNESSRIFARILDRLGRKDLIKLEVVGFMPLNFEKLEENILTPWGVAATYSLSHSYVQNGDLMRDPEMVFLVIDNRKNASDFEDISIYPTMYQQDNLGLYEESVTIANHQIQSFIKVWQYSHCNFANLWLKNIRAQGFLK